LQPGRRIAAISVDEALGDTGAVRLRVISLAAAAALIAPASAYASVSHVVAAGESLSSIAESDGLTVQELAAANGLSPEAALVEGSTVTIPPQAEGASESAPGAGATQASAEGAAPSASSYAVAPGDTLSAIAASAGTSTDALAEANGIDPTAPLLAGAVLRLPGPAPGASAGSSGAQAAQALSSSEGPYPTEETVTPTEVGSIAQENGVPPSLAEAIAAQESGFSNNVTSSAGARGVMQIMPETWRSISTELAGSTPLAPASAVSNVRGGVLLLQSLLQASGGDPGLAAAGYYQGLESVLQEGEGPETEEYVSSVLALRRQFGGE
jgi:N-acetylmuramoyl-L-alanine amidase